MGWLTRGYGPIPWPLVRRSRLVRELKQQGDAYRQNVYAAEAAQRRAQRELAEKTKGFVDAVNTLSGWREEDGTYIHVDAPDGLVQHFRMRNVRDVRGCRVSFVCDVSDEMLNRMRYDGAMAGLVLRSVVEQLTKEAIYELAERGWKL